MLKRSVIFCILALFFLLSPAYAALLLLPERTVTCEEGEITPLKYGDHTAGCILDRITDRDILTFEGAVGENIKIIVVSTSTQMDPRIVLRDPDGDVLVDDNCTNFLCEIVTELTLPKTGTYSMFLSERDTNETGGYQIQLERIPPTQTPLSLSIPYEFPGNDAINTLTDVDFITFEGAANTEISLSVVSTSTQMDPNLVVRDPQGTVILDTFCINFLCNITETLNLTISGIYLMELSDRFIDEPGNYLVEIKCEFPLEGCPDDLDRDTITDLSDNCIRVDNILQDDMDDDGLGDLCDADLNNDGSANSNDLGVFAENFGSISSEIIPHEGDFDMDEDSDGADLGFLIAVGIGTFGPSGLVP